MQKADSAPRLNFFNLKTIIISVKTFQGGWDENAFNDITVDIMCVRGKII